MRNKKEGPLFGGVFGVIDGFLGGRETYTCVCGPAGALNLPKIKRLVVEGWWWRYVCRAALQTHASPGLNMCTLLIARCSVLDLPCRFVPTAAVYAWIYGMGHLSAPGNGLSSQL